MNSPAFQFYVKQWLGDKDILLMSWDARAMHLHLMCIAWQENPPGTLTDNDAILRQYVGNPPNWKALKRQIFRAWKHEGKRWIQIGLRREYEKQKRFSDVRKTAAMKRWHSDAYAMHEDALQSSSSTAVLREEKNPPFPIKSKDEEIKKEHSVGSSESFDKGNGKGRRSDHDKRMKELGESIYERKYGAQLRAAKTKAEGEKIRRQADEEYNRGAAEILRGEV